MGLPSRFTEHSTELAIPPAARLCGLVARLCQDDDSDLAIIIR